MTERRRFARIPVELRLKFKSVEQIGNILDGHSADLSLGGIFIRTSHIKPLGTKVMIELPGEDEVFHIKGTVRSIRYDRGEPIGVGIEFENMDENTLSLIKQLILRHS